MLRKACQLQAGSARLLPCSDRTFDEMLDPPDDESVRLTLLFTLESLVFHLWAWHNRSESGSKKQKERLGGTSCCSSTLAIKKAYSQSLGDCENDRPRNSKRTCGHSFRASIRQLWHEGEEALVSSGLGIEVDPPPALAPVSTSSNKRERRSSYPDSRWSHQVGSQLNLLMPARSSENEDCSSCSSNSTEKPGSPFFKSDNRF